MKRAANVGDYRALARARLPHFLFEYLDGGSYDEATLAANVSDLRDVKLRQRVLRDVSALDLSVELFGQKWSLPVGLGPVGMMGMYARRGEVQAARAAREANVPYTLSSLSVCPVGEIASELQAPFWLQLYIIKDRPFVTDLLAKAREAKCSALLLTVDLPVSGSRYRDNRSGLSGGTRLQRAIQGMMRPGWAWDVGLLGPAAQSRQSRARPRQEHRSRRLFRLDRRQLRCLDHLGRRGLGPRALGRAADHQGHP